MYNVRTVDCRGNITTDKTTITVKKHHKILTHLNFTFENEKKSSLFGVRSYVEAERPFLIPEGSLDNNSHRE